jgi:hypothetical protein
MDPNTALRDLREAIAEYDNDMNKTAAGPADRLREAAGTLDEWLSKGGFLPDAWQANRTP